MKNTLFYTLGISFASGIFFRSFFVVSDAELLAIFATAFFCALVWRMRSWKKNSALLLGGIALIAFGLGVFRLDIAEQATSSFVSELNQIITFTGTVTREPVYGALNVQFAVQPENTRELLLVSTSRFQDVAYGDVVEVQGSLREPCTFLTDLGRTFDYPGYLKAQGTPLTVSFATITVERHGTTNPMLMLLYRGKTAFMLALERALPEPMAGLGEGLLLGEKRALGEDLSHVFQTVGIVHIIVLSGYNVMIVISAIMGLFAFATIPRTRLVIGIVVIAGFATLVGFTATVLRASIMAALLLIARTTGRTYVIMRALIFAAVVMLLFNPYLLAFDPGFALSFLATLGLVLVAPLVERWLARVPSTLGIRETVTATISTQFFVLPFILYQMGTLSLVALFANVLVLPIVPYAMLLTFITGVCGLILPFLGTLVGFSAYLSLWYIIGVAERFATVPFASFSVPTFPFWVVLVSYGIIGIALALLHRRLAARSIAPEPTFAPLVQKAPDAYADWVIEEEYDEQKSPRETQSVSRGDISFPF